MTTNYFASGLRTGQQIGSMFDGGADLERAKNKVLSGQDPMVVLQELMSKDPGSAQEFIEFLENMNVSEPNAQQGMFGGTSGLRSQQPQQQQANSGNPFSSGMSSGLNMGSNLQSIFGGGGSAASTSMSMGASQAGYAPEVMSAWQGGGAAAGGGASAGAAGGSSAGGMLASAGPWAALAAAILINENEAREGGYRDEDDWEYAKDLFGGKVLSQDINERWSPKLFGDDDYGFGGDMEVFGELSTLDFSNAWDKLKNDSTIAKLLKKVF